MRILSERPLLSLPLFIFSFLCVVNFLIEGFGPHHLLQDHQVQLKNLMKLPVGATDVAAASVLASSKHRPAGDILPRASRVCASTASPAATCLQFKSSSSVAEKRNEVILKTPDASSGTHREIQVSVRIPDSMRESQFRSAFKTGELKALQPEITDGSSSC